MLLILPIMVILSQIIVMDRTLITNIFYYITCINGQILAGHDFAVMVGYIIICIDSDVATGNDVGIIGFFLNDACMDGPCKFTHSIIIT